jgi:hypothetical protein
MDQGKSRDLQLHPSYNSQGKLLITHIHGGLELSILTVSNGCSKL